MVKQNKKSHWPESYALRPGKKRHRAICQTNSSCNTGAFELKGGT
jgi:hypothetical protein